jgi:hypothetical protein
MVERVLRNSPDTVPDTSPFFGKSLTEATRMLEESSAEVDDLTVVALVSFFEQFMLDYLQELAEQVGRTCSTPLTCALVSHAFKDVERWRFSDVLRLFKGEVDPSLLDQVQSIYKYRNWVAHGKRKPKPVVTDPIKSYEALSLFLKNIGAVR